MRQICFLLFLLQACFFPLWAQEEVPKRVYQTRALGEFAPPKIDGLVNDPCWQTVEWSGKYVEWSPEENTTPSEETSLKILYDNKNIYVAFRCFDHDPSGIVKRLSRRDGFDGDWVEINIDSFRDFRTAFSFTISAAGVKGEEFISNNGANWDPTWNPIWYAKTQIDSLGWTAEIRIPLSQLRFGEAGEQVWGIQSTRRYFRKEERSLWQRSPLNAPGWVSNFGELHGLSNLKPRRPFAVKPYILGDGRTFPAVAGNPFRDGRDSRFSSGLDAKIGVSSDIMLDVSINPDFGQVEADPSAIALDGFQIFFPEQRPFFIESKNIFDYKFAASQAGNTFGFDNLFYSRRIGRAPQGFPSLRAGEFSEQPEITTILGAAKLSGKTKNGWSIGILESITADEEATISNLQTTRRESVEPLTNYFVSRIQKDMNKRNTFIGGIVTATNRQLEGKLDHLHKAAYSGGLDFKHQWQNRRYYTGGSLVFSRVSGSQQAILNTQRSIRHLFQRSDADYVDIDTSRTALSGSGGNLQIGKASGNWRFETGATWHSPELELNDLGFQIRADDIRHYGWASYRTTKPLKRIRQFTVNYTQLAAFDYGGNLNDITLNINGWVHLKNNWWINGALFSTPLSYSNTVLRGGPRMRLEESLGYRNGIISDSRRQIRLTLNHSGEWGSEGAHRTHEIQGNLTWQPTNALQLSVIPRLRFHRNRLEYVTTRSFESQARFIAANLDQHTFELPLRLDYILLPNLSIQYWGQPFISRGRYQHFKYVSDPLASNFRDRFTQIDEQLSFANGVYSADENGDGNSDYQFSNPDFAFIQWRANLVLRWEYIPGSELFLVWSQDLSRFGDASQTLYDGLDSNILDKQPQNIFLIKATYHLMN